MQINYRRMKSFLFNIKAIEYFKSNLLIYFVSVTVISIVSDLSISFNHKLHFFNICVVNLGLLSIESKCNGAVKPHLKQISHPRFLVIRLTLSLAWFCPPGGGYPYKKVGDARRLLWGYKSTILASLGVFMTTQNYFYLSKYLSGCTGKKKMIETALISVLGSISAGLWSLVY